ncbi:MAG: hypothetical protein MH321_01645 [Leptospiraceae bacterium]|nr:hypothetical protein [Leptospiraceae bacterium]
MRAGTFFSKSVRGISLVLQRLIKKTEEPDIQALKLAYEKSGMKFPDTGYRPTTREDLSHGLQIALKSNGLIMSILGDWTWEENSMPQLPDWIPAKLD